MQATVQRYIDSSISKTINVSRDLDFDIFKNIYREAYSLGCKGCTTYRPNQITGAVLEAKPYSPTFGIISGAPAGEAPAARACPKCGQPAIIRQENCDICLNCGHSGCV